MITSHGLNPTSRMISEISVMSCCTICSVALTMVSALMSARRRAFCSVIVEDRIFEKLQVQLIACGGRGMY